GPELRFRVPRHRGQRAPGLAARDGSHRSRRARKGREAARLDGGRLRAQAVGGRLAAGAEDGGGRPPGGRHRPRLQQPADRDHGPDGAPAAASRRPRIARRRRRGDRESRGARRRPDQPPRCVQPEAGPAAQGHRTPRQCGAHGCVALGLSMVYGIVNQSGGAIRVDSEAGGGSTFTIYLARVDDPIAMIEPKGQATEAPQGSETILVVEDEDDVREVVCRTLRINGYTVLQARHGSEALAIADRQTEPIHLLLTDVVMPRMNGRELAEQLVPRRPEMKVLYMSGYADDLVLHHRTSDQDAEFLQKPFSCDALGRR